MVNFLIFDAYGIYLEMLIVFIIINVIIIGITILSNMDRCVLCMYIYISVYVYVYIGMCMHVFVYMCIYVMVRYFKL